LAVVVEYKIVQFHSQDRLFDLFDRRLSHFRNWENFASVYSLDALNRDKE
jgi:hypothetical protein